MIAFDRVFPLACLLNLTLFNQCIVTNESGETRQAIKGYDVRKSVQDAELKGFILASQTITSANGVTITPPQITDIADDAQVASSVAARSIPLTDERNYTEDSVESCLKTIQTQALTNYQVLLDKAVPFPDYEFATQHGLLASIACSLQESGKLISAGGQNI